MYVYLTGPVECGSPVQYLLLYTEGTTSSIPLTCTEMDAVVQTWLTSYLSSCRSHMGSKFTEGVHGEVSRLESINLNWCEQAEYTQWQTEMCCPGGSSNGI